VSIQPVSRRSFLTGAVVAAGAGVIGYVVARNSDAASPTLSGAANAYGNAPQKAAVLASLSQLQNGGIVKHGVVLTRDSSGTVHAVSATCTHQGCSVGAPHNGVVTCPCHGSEFEATTGKVLRGPATQPLPPVAVEVQGDQVVER
jgi:Rieske Fe-S protein